MGSVAATLNGWISRRTLAPLSRSGRPSAEALDERGGDGPQKDPPDEGGNGPQENRNARVLRPVRNLDESAPRVGLEPTTFRLTAGCSTIELPRNHFLHRAFALIASPATDLYARTITSLTHGDDAPTVTAKGCSGDRII